jgi:fucose 4-O-acetylase-like acetyltransferase
MQRQHLDYIDAMKGFGMFLVVMGHVIAWSFGVYENGQPNITCAASLLWRNVIYTFHMPLLMFVSGYLFISSSRPFGASMLKDYLWRKTYTLLIPFFFAGWVFSVITGQSMLKYWFLRTLFLFILISLPIELLRNRMKSEHVRVVADFIWYGSWSFALFFVLPRWSLPGDVVFDFGHITLYYSFALGVLCKRYGVLQRLLDSNWVFTICLIIFIVDTYVNNLTDVRGWHLYGLGYLYSISGIACSYYLFKNTFDGMGGAILKGLRYVGKHSLEVYILHFYFVLSFPAIGRMINQYMLGDSFSKAAGSTVEIVSSVILATVVCTLSLTVARVVRTSNFLSQYFLGRKNK